MKVLKYVGKGRWQEIDEQVVLSTDKIKQASRTKHTPASRLELFFERLIKSIEENGYRTIKVSSLLDNFSISKRSSKNVVTIKEQLQSKGLYTLPEYSNELKLESTFFPPLVLSAWGFYIGGYQPAQKWLKARKGRAGI